MKSLLFILAMLALTATAFANEKGSSVEATRTRITCYNDAEYNHEQLKGNNKGKQIKEVVNNKISESIRISWKEGNLEHRLSDVKAFNEEGKTTSQGKYLLIIENTQQGNLLTEQSEINGITQITDDRLNAKGRKLGSSSTKASVVYEISGDKKIVKEASLNGQPDPSRVGEIVTTLNAGNKSVEKTVRKTPYVTYESENVRITAIKEEISCSFESMSY